MHDKLAQRCRALVAVAAVDHEQPPDVLELRDGEVGRQGRLLTLLKPEKIREGDFRHKTIEQCSYWPKPAEFCCVNSAEFILR